jgi:hypothetical protein
MKGERELGEGRGIRERKEGKKKAQETPKGVAQISEATSERQKFPDIDHRDSEANLKFS